MTKATQEAVAWEARASREVAKIEKILLPLGYSLDKDQPHIQGERFLMTKDKIVLLASNNKNGKRVVVKASNSQSGIKEIQDEKRIRDVLTKTFFASDTILLPSEIYYGYADNYLFWIIEYIPQEKVFASYLLKDQFFMTLRIFEEQESFHASTFEHLQTIRKIIPILYAKDYLERFEEFETNISNQFLNGSVSQALKEARVQLEKKKEVINLYCRYMSHADLAPSNFRIYKQKIYYLDLSSVVFGNKHESWARFMNWAMLHSPKLEPILNKYICDNRASEIESLRLMRIYKAGFLIDYHAKAVLKTSGDLRKLESKRVELWTKILMSFLEKRVISANYIKTCQREFNTLKTPEELARQREFNLIIN